MVQNPLYPSDYFTLRALGLVLEAGGVREDGSINRNVLEELNIILSTGSGGSVPLYDHNTLDNSLSKVRGRFPWLIQFKRISRGAPRKKRIFTDQRGGVYGSYVVPADFVESIRELLPPEEWDRFERDRRIIRSVGGIGEKLRSVDYSRYYSRPNGRGFIRWIKIKYFGDRFQNLLNKRSPTARKIILSIRAAFDKFGGSGVVRFFKRTWKVGELLNLKIIQATTERRPNG